MSTPRVVCRRAEPLTCSDRGAALGQRTGCHICCPSVPPIQDHPRDAASQFRLPLPGALIWELLAFRLGLSFSEAGSPLGGGV